MVQTCKLGGEQLAVAILREAGNNGY